MSSHQSATQYRADIDGLRAIAVSLVVVHHIDSSLLPGGYVGVDVFFVISGFLITGFLISDFDADRFRLLHFYERRARRILPALVTMLAATTIAAVLILPPEELRDFAASVPAALFMFANMHMRALGGYFGTDMHTVPLLHLWSIAVEEQFYLIYPILLWGLHRWWPRRLSPIVITALVAFFIFAALHAARGRPGAYYLLENRAWELLVGACVWLCHPLLTRLLAPVRAVAAPIGLGCIATSAVVFNARTGVPGWPALLPTLGAALILIPCGTGPGIRLLTASPLTLLGKMSYSLYLWHWPILVFAKVTMLEPSWLVRIGLLATSLLAAYISYRVIEIPCRRRSPERSPVRFLLGLGAACVPIVTIAAISMVRPTWTGTVPPNIGQQLAELRWGKEQIRDCGVVRHGDIVVPCNVGATESAAPIYVIGDSHAGALAGGLAEATGRSVMVDTIATCPPIREAAHTAGEINGTANGRSCRVRNSSLPKRLLEDPRAGTVVLAAAWYKYRDAASDEAHPTFSHLADETQNLAETLRAAGKVVVIVGPVPPQTNHIGIAYGRAAAGWAASLNTSRADLGPAYTEAARTFASLGARSPITVIDPQTTLCNTDVCFGVRDGLPLYYDDNHLSHYGANRVGLLIDTALRRQATPQPIATMP